MYIQHPLTPVVTCAHWSICGMDLARVEGKKDKYRDEEKKKKKRNRRHRDKSTRGGGGEEEAEEVK